MPARAVGLGIELVDPGEDAHVLVHHLVPLRVGGGVEVVLAGDDVDHEGARLVDPAVHVRDRDAVGLEQLLESHLVLEREERCGVGAVTAHHHRRLLAVAHHVDEPDRPPARLLSNSRDLSPEVLLAPVVSRCSVRSTSHPRVSLRPMIPFMISVVPP